MERERKRDGEGERESERNSRGRRKTGWKKNEKKMKTRKNSNLDLVRRLKAVELVEQLEHCALDLGVSAAAAGAAAGRADGVDLFWLREAVEFFVLEAL